jgi:hypothetical protein
MKASDEERRRLASDSIRFNLNDNTFLKLFPDLVQKMCSGEIRYEVQSRAAADAHQAKKVCQETFQEFSWAASLTIPYPRRALLPETLKPWSKSDEDVPFSDATRTDEWSDFELCSSFGHAFLLRNKCGLNCCSLFPTFDRRLPSAH